MKYFGLIFAAAIIFIFTACNATAPVNYENVNSAPGVEDAKAVIKLDSDSKTYEMYSWKARDSKYRYVILSGVRGEYSFEKITTEYVPVIGTPNLVSLLKELKGGEQIFWGIRQIPGFSYPPQAEVQEILRTAREKGINIEIIYW